MGKTLGQLAYEAKCADLSAAAYFIDWGDLSDEQQVKWDRVGEAVHRAVIANPLRFGHE